MKLKSFTFPTVIVSKVNQEITLSCPYENRGSRGRDSTLLSSLSHAQNRVQFPACGRHNILLKSKTEPHYLPSHDSSVCPLHFQCPLAEDSCVQSSIPQQHSPRQSDLREMPCLMHGLVDSTMLSFVVLDGCMSALMVTKFAAGCLLECLATEARKFQNYKHSK